MPAPRVRAARDLASIGILLTALVLPGLGLIAGLGGAPPGAERRALAERPALPASLSSAGDYARRFDAFLNDHFAFRTDLLRLYNHITTLWLSRRPTESVEVMVGRNGWLYYTGNETLRFLEGRNPFLEAEVRAWDRSIRARARWLAQRGIRYLVVFTPDKGTIYPEYLPEWVRPSRHGSRLDQLMTVMPGGGEAAIVDLRRTLLDAKRAFARPVYAATDSHWNALGTHAAYREIVARLGLWFPGTRPAPLSSFALTWERLPGGDLARMLGLERQMFEDTPILTPGVPARARPIDPDPDEAARWRQAGRQAAVTTREGAGIESAIVFHDSFATALVPLLAEHFGRAVFLWTYDFDCDAIERERPSVVIQEYAERMLSVMTPRNPPQVNELAKAELR